MVDSKLLPDDICTVEAYIIPHNHKIWQVMSYQTSLILRDKISEEGVQEHQEMLGVVWANNGNTCTYTILRYCSTHCCIAPALASHIHLGSVAYNVLATSPAFRQIETSLIHKHKGVKDFTSLTKYQINFTVKSYSYSKVYNKYSVLCNFNIYCKYLHIMKENP